MSYKLLIKGIQAAAIGSVGYVTYDGGQKILEQRQTRLDQIEAVRVQIEQEREKLDKVLSDKVVIDIVERNAHEIESTNDQKAKPAIKPNETPKQEKKVEKAVENKVEKLSPKPMFELVQSQSVRYLQDELTKASNEQP